MKNLLFILFIALTSSLAYAAESPYRVIKVETPFSMGTVPSDVTPTNNYYVTMGWQHGLERGTTLNVYRDRRLEAEMSNVSIATRVFVGQLQAVDFQDRYCIARIEGLAGDANPLRERDAVLVGDYVLPALVIQSGQLFAEGSATLLPGALRYLVEAAVFIKNNNPSRATIEDHTDSDGSPEFNLKLSELRAAAVRDYLINQAEIDPRILVPKGYGKSRSVAPHDTSKGQAKNRRLEIVIEPRLSR